MIATGDGIGYLVGEGAEARIVRTMYLDRPAAIAIVARARALREQAGRLAGYAVGQDQAVSDIEAAGSGTRLLTDILAVVPAAEPKVWNETVVTRLAELRPEIYGGWEPEQLTAYRLASSGELPSRRLGGRVYIVTAELLAMVEGAA